MSRHFSAASTACAATALLLGLLVTPAQATGSPAAGGSPVGATYVALGDSYSAGEGLGPFQSGTAHPDGSQKNTCHRSKHDAYPELQSIVLPTVSDRAFWACSGATVADMVATPGQAGTPKQSGQPAQTSTVGSSTKYISLTVGGDDVGFGNIGTACAELIGVGHVVRFSSSSCASQVQHARNGFKQLRANLISLYSNLLSHSADTQLVVGGYPKIFPDSYKGADSFQGDKFCTFDHLKGTDVSVGMPVSDAKAVAKFEADLNQVIASSVSAVATSYPAQIGFADLYPASIARNCRGYTKHATVAGLELSPLGQGIDHSWKKRFISSATFHPTKDGQKVYAKAVQAGFAALTTSVLHSIVFDDSPGTAAPPATLGPYTMTTFGDEPNPQGTEVNSIAGPPGQISFSYPGLVDQVGDGWQTWSHDYQGAVYAFGDEDASSSVTLTLPPNTKAVYFYAEPDRFETFDLTADANNGTTSGAQSVFGNAGASYFGFYAEPGYTITRIAVSCSDNFALGEFATSS